jgi:peptidoglycan L-alanyl-D-glutamate endopeptidase CwlK
MPRRKAGKKGPGRPRKASPKRADAARARGGRQRSGGRKRGAAASRKAPKRPLAKTAAPAALAPQPAADRDPGKLHPVLRQKLEAALGVLRQNGTPFALVEGYRTLERQQWLYGAGRTGVPFSRPDERIVTYADGVHSRSKHQGDGSPGTGRAADCCPLKNGAFDWPNASDPVWRRYADAVRAQGLAPGLDWPSFKDAPHCELP